MFEDSSFDIWNCPLPLLPVCAWAHVWAQAHSISSYHGVVWSIYLKTNSTNSTCHILWWNLRRMRAVLSGLWSFPGAELAYVNLLSKNNLCRVLILETSCLFSLRPSSPCHGTLLGARLISEAAWSSPAPLVHSHLLLFQTVLARGGGAVSTLGDSNHLTIVEHF